MISLVFEDFNKLIISICSLKPFSHIYIYIYIYIIIIIIIIIKG